ncbi:MAG: hypothetical protein FJZ90_11120, partial [Chloroflexi bacterium]|nr:hypothetical protein [Chloroflexota bacterium]
MSAKLPWLAVLVNLAIDLVVIAGLCALVGLDLAAYRERTRGIESGLAVDAPALVAPRYGVNVALEQYEDDAALAAALDGIRSLGVGAIRQRFAWCELEPAPGAYRWEAWDRILPQLRVCELEVVAVLDTSPAWARAPWEANNPYAPPTSPEAYARFAGALAARYGDYIIAYQIWDEPNIAPHWGQRAIDPAGYVALLRSASEAIRRADPDALIIAGGLAPNTEAGGRNLSDLLFVREMYRLGAADAFDVLGVKAFGFWTGPGDRRVAPEMLNFSRAILLREEMVRRGDGHKSVWAMDGGWCALPSDWSGRPSSQGSDEPLVQAGRLQRALERIEQEWSWMGLAFLGHYQPPAAPDDPIWGYALLDADGRATLAHERLREALADNGVLYPGLHPMAGTLPRGRPEFDLTRFPFWGTDLALDVEKGPSGGALTVSVSGLPREITFDLHADAPTLERVRIGRWLEPDIRQARLRGSEGDLRRVRAVAIGHRPVDRRMWLGVVVGALAALWLASGAWRTARALPMRRIWRAWRARWEALPEGLAWPTLVLPFGLLVLAPAQELRLLGLALYGGFSLLQPERALLIAVACIPLAPLRTALGPGAFSLTEVSVLIAFGAWAWNGLLRSPREPNPRRREAEVAPPPDPALEGIARPTVPVRVRVRRASPGWGLRLLDGGVLLLVILGLGTSFLAVYRREALREWRVMVLESALLYVMIRTWSPSRDESRLLRLADVFWFAGVGVAVIALVGYLFFDLAIIAEGVRRARAIYGSPNNLALYLGRLLPLGLAMALWGRTRWRRWTYALGGLAVASALFLTYSRGAWFLAVPAAFLGVMLARRARLVWLVLGL